MALHSGDVERQDAARLQVPLRSLKRGKQLFVVQQQAQGVASDDNQRKPLVEREAAHVVVDQALPQPTATQASKATPAGTEHIGVAVETPSVNSFGQQRR
jgi:hypothetical protein